MSSAMRAAPPSFGALVQAFFAEHLTQQRALSPQTVAAYRDAFVLFLDFAQARLHKTPTTLSLADLTPALILDFLDHLERDRHNTVRSRNARLAALRSFLKFAARRDVTALQVVEHALGVPMKRFERPMFEFLTREEMLAVIGAPGAPITASISSRVRNPNIGRSKRFIGTPSACSTICNAVTSRRAANFRNVRSAASRALRLRTVLCRSRSR